MMFQLVVVDWKSFTNSISPKEMEARQLMEMLGVQLSLTLSITLNN